MPTEDTRPKSVLTVRLDAANAELLRLIAEADGRRLNEEINLAVAELVKSRMQSPALQEHVRAKLVERQAQQERLQETLEELAAAQ
jgi:hypothetical protein